MLSEKEFDEKIGSAILLLRNKNRYSSENLATFSGVDYSTINLIENGRRTPTSYTLYKLLFTMGVDLTDFLIEKSPDRKDLENHLNIKLKSLDSDQIKALIDFIGSYDLRSKDRTD